MSDDIKTDNNVEQLDPNAGVGSKTRKYAKIAGGVALGVAVVAGGVAYARSRKNKAEEKAVEGETLS